MASTCERAVTSDDFIPVSVSMLVPEAICGVALYTREGLGNSMRLFRGPDYPITTADLRRLTAAGHSWLYVSAIEHQQFQKYLRENLECLVQDESRALKDRVDTLNRVVRDVLAESFRKNDLTDVLCQTQRLGANTVDLLCREDFVVSELSGVLFHDYHTFTHSANVAYYAVLLAKRLGIESRTELNEIAGGALLHDLGKLEIPEAILTKPARLNDRELSIMKRHPTLGFRRLCTRQEVTFGQLMMTYQHHERLDGRGYPVGVSDREIHDWSRLVSVVDVFEALTSSRPYRAGMTSDDAFTIMDRASGTAFDRNIYECWKTTIKNG